MGTAIVKWIEGKQFVGIDSTHHSVVLSTPRKGLGSNRLNCYSLRWPLARPWMSWKSWRKNACR